MRQGQLRVNCCYSALIGHAQGLIGLVLLVHLIVGFASLQQLAQAEGERERQSVSIWETGLKIQQRAADLSRGWSQIKSTELLETCLSQADIRLVTKVSIFPANATQPSSIYRGIQSTLTTNTLPHTVS